jgi:hypothetical protein
MVFIFSMAALFPAVNDGGIPEGPAGGRALFSLANRARMVYGNTYWGGFTIR